MGARCGMAIAGGALSFDARRDTSRLAASTARAVSTRTRRRSAAAVCASASAAFSLIEAREAVAAFARMSVIAQTQTPPVMTAVEAHGVMEAGENSAYHSRSRMEIEEVTVQYPGVLLSEVLVTVYSVAGTARARSASPSGLPTAQRASGPPCATATTSAVCNHAFTPTILLRPTGRPPADRGRPSHLVLTSRREPGSSSLFLFSFFFFLLFFHFFPSPRVAHTLRSGFWLNA